MENFIEHAVRGEVRLSHARGKFSALVTAMAKSDRYDDDYVLLALSLVGAGTALDAIRATASKGRVLPFLAAGQSSTTDIITENQSFKLFKARIEAHRRDHYILLNNRLFEPSIDEDWQYVIAPINAEPAHVLGSALRRISLIPVLPAWYERVHQSAQNQGTGFVRVDAEGGFAIWRIYVNDDHWHKIIERLLTSGLITMEGS